MQLVERYELGDMTAQYLRDGPDTQLGLLLIPATAEERLVPARPTLAGVREVAALPGAPGPARRTPSLVQLHLTGSPQSAGWAAGRSMLLGPDSEALRYSAQELIAEGETQTVITHLTHPRGLTVSHRLRHRADAPFLDSWVTVQNDGQAPIGLELLTSFHLSHLSPFAEDEATGRLRVHRFRSSWSAEGRLVTGSAEALDLEPAWSRSGTRSVRFGQVGSMPVRGWFPFVAVEDGPAEVVWAASVASAGSWQIELLRRDDGLQLSGGLGDYEHAHWRKAMAPGETLSTPVAHLTTVAGSLDDACTRLVEAQRHPVAAIDADMPVLFNEFCTTWGQPAHQRVVKIADRLNTLQNDSGPRYLVIDAGWYRPAGSAATWSGAQGDWLPSPDLFPDGLEATAEAIRQRGLVPGLWFEAETVGEHADAWNRSELLHRDGIPLQSGGRRFWDLRNDAAHRYLEERVIDLLDRCGFGYLKIDYNETIGLGVDPLPADRGTSPPDGLGEGLRQHIEGVHRFLRRVRQRLPHLVIENCSSGGHRLEPSLVAATDMSSFSDAHEAAAIPIIAGNLQRLVLPRHSQIWAVLRATDSHRRLVYSLAATFLGRMCLSGDVEGLDVDQWELVARACRLYRDAAPLVDRGRSQRVWHHGVASEADVSYLHPVGWQIVVRNGASGARRQLLVVAHRFAGPAPPVEASPDSLRPVARGDWQLVGALHEPGVSVSIGGGRLVIDGLEEMAASVTLWRSE